MTSLSTRLQNCGLVSILAGELAIGLAIGMVCLHVPAWPLVLAVGLVLLLASSVVLLCANATLIREMVREFRGGRTR